MAPIAGPLVPCKNGYHLAPLEHLFEWGGPFLYEAEIRGETLVADGKVVAREARLLRRVDTWTSATLRRYACDCAERALVHYEQRYPLDGRPRRAIETARRWADGAATIYAVNIAYEEAQAAYAARLYRAAYAPSGRDPDARVAAYAAYAAKAVVWSPDLDVRLDTRAITDTLRSASEAVFLASEPHAHFDRIFENPVYQRERNWQRTRLAQYLDAT